MIFVYVQVHPKSPSAKRGLKPGDMVLAICRTPAANLTHDQAKMEILRAGNELDFTVQRYCQFISNFYWPNEKKNGSNK